MGGGGSDTGPSVQQQELEKNQAMQTADLNLEENAQRKAILSSMNGMRLFRGSALSRAVAGNTDGGIAPVGAPSGSQRRAGVTGSAIGVAVPSLLDGAANGSTAAGGTGASGGGGTAPGGRPGGAPGRPTGRP